MDEKTLLTIIPMTVTIVGAFTAILLAVNAFFLKGLISSIQEMKIQLATLTTEHGLLASMSSAHDIDIKKTRERMHEIVNSIAECRMNTVKIDSLEEKVNEIKISIASIKANN